MEKNNNSIAKLALGLSVLLLVAVIILFVKMPNGANDTANETKVKDSTKVVSKIVDDGILKVAYFYADSLSLNLSFMKDLEKDVLAAQKSAEDKMMKKQREIEAWQQKWANKGQLLSSEQAEFAKQGQQMQQEAMMFEQNVQMELQQKQENLLRINIKRISDASKVFAEENGFDLIFSYQLGQNLYYASEIFDVTAELTAQMNADYEASFSKPESND